MVVVGVARRHVVGLHNRCTLTFCPTPQAASQLRRWGIQRVDVIGRGVDSDLFHPARRSAVTRARYGISATEPVLLYVGRLSAEKNLERLRQTATALPACRLVIVGDGPDRAALAAALPASAVLTGFLTGQDLAEVYAMADVFIFPSLTETFGQVVQEAMASGLPVVAMRAGGVPAIVAQGQTGWLCQPEALDDWLAAIVDLVRQPALARQFGAAGRRRVAGNTWSVLFEQLLARYQQALSPQGESHVATR
jgi:glycosyltransferase involved in cell wall biosynthesis